MFVPAFTIELPQYWTSQAIHLPAVRRLLASRAVSAKVQDSQGFL